MMMSQNSLKDQEMKDHYCLRLSDYEEDDYCVRFPSAVDSTSTGSHSDWNDDGSISQISDSIMSSSNSKMQQSADIYKAYAHHDNLRNIKDRKHLYIWERLAIRGTFLLLFVWNGV